MELLYAAWPQAKVAELIELNALALHLAGVEFCAIDSTAESEELLLSDPAQAGCEVFASFPGEEYGIVAYNRGQVAGVLKMAAADLDGTTIVTIRGMATQTGCRGRGLGTVMLGYIRRFTYERFGRLPDRTLSLCAAGQARLYQRAGFSVYKPGTHIPVVPTQSTAIRMPADSTHSHVVVRDRS